jgi:hypothetical protein
LPQVARRGLIKGQVCCCRRQPWRAFSRGGFRSMRHPATQGAPPDSARAHYRICLSRVVDHCFIFEHSGVRRRR